MYYRYVYKMCVTCSKAHVQNDKFMNLRKCTKYGHVIPQYDGNGEQMKNKDKKIGKV